MATVQDTFEADAADIAEKKSRSALGVGVITLVTILVVLLLASFAVLSLVSAQSNYHLSQMAVTQDEAYYAADSEATLWYAELDAFAATLVGESDSFAVQLSQAGYTVETTSAGELRVLHSVTMNENRSLMVTVAVNDDTTTTIREWHS